MSTVYVSIGNSDDKLPQKRWKEFQKDLEKLVQDLFFLEELKVYGIWHSSPVSQFQNMCLAVGELTEETSEALKASLAILAKEYDQDSIAWAEVLATEFVRPAQIHNPED